MSALWKEATKEEDTRSPDRRLTNTNGPLRFAHTRADLVAGNLSDHSKLPSLNGILFRTLLFSSMPGLLPPFRHTAFHLRHGSALVCSYSCMHGGPGVMGQAMVQTIYPVFRRHDITRRST